MSVPDSAAGAGVRAAPARRGGAILVVAAYVLLALVPLLVALLPPVPRGRAFWVECSVAVGFIGLGQMALQFALIARFAVISRPFGIDLVMQYHRQMGILGLVLVLLHPAILAAARPDFLRTLFLDPAGVLAAAALVLLVLLSFSRKRLRLGYEAWRVTHGLLALGGLALGQIHVCAVGVYAEAPWKQVVTGLWCAAFAGLLVHLRLVKPALLRRRPWEVVEVRSEGPETWTVALAPIGHPGMRFAPGQFAWMKVGSPWTQHEHPFSFSSSAEAAGRVEFGIKELGDFTDRIGTLRPGTRAFLDGPHGSFTTEDHPAEGYLFVAGGIGISPILSMLRTLADRGDGRSHVLVYGGWRLDHVAFRDELDRLARALDLWVVLVLQEPPEGWEGPRGFVTRGVLEGLVEAGGVARHVFVCGPNPMLTAVEDALRSCGVPAGRIHMERFDIV